MIYAAQIIDGIVIRVLVVPSIQWCEQNEGGEWIETYYNGSQRGKYAGIGDIYDADLDEFTSPVDTNPPGPGVPIP
jgi:hypothetical protein